MTGAFFAVQKALALMNDGGSFILHGSSRASKAPCLGTYGATKAAVRNLVGAWTVGLKDRRIRSIPKPGRSRHLGSIYNPQKPLRGSWPPFRWDAWESRTK